MTKRVTIYARVSTKDQHPEAQAKQLRQCVKDKRIDVVKV